MTSTVPERTSLGGSTLNRKWYLDVDESDSDTPSWIGVFGLTEFQPGLDATLQDDSDFDGGGYKSQTKTAEQWTLTGKVSRKVTADSATAYDPGQEKLRTKAAQMGPANTAHVRWYEMTPSGPRVEAYEGYAAVSWSPDGGAMDALDIVSITLTGQGKRNEITHPDADGSGAAKPVISSLSPASVDAAGGELVMITGTGFSSATAVSVGGDDVDTDDWEIASSTKIALVTPAHTAGTAAVIVTNGVGASESSNLTYTSA